GNDAVFRAGTKALRRILGIVRVVAAAAGRKGAGNGGLVWNDEDIAKGAELLGDRRDEVVANQDVFVLFLNQLKPRGHDYFDYVLTRRQHGEAGPQGVGIDAGGRDRIGNANRA